jgi:Flp pilus assembly protein TadD
MVNGIALALVAALAAAPALAETVAEPDRVDVAFEALAEGRTAEAMAQLQASREQQAGDPAVLINLGTAYARQGRIEEARAMFEAAMTSSERYDLELADGSWVDSRMAAKMALNNLGANLEGSTGATLR